MRRFLTGFVGVFLLAGPVDGGGLPAAEEEQGQAAAAAETLSAEEAAWNWACRGGTAVGFARFINGFPESRRCETAFRRMVRANPSSVFDWGRRLEPSSQLQALVSRLLHDDDPRIRCEAACHLFWFDELCWFRELDRAFQGELVLKFGAGLARLQEHEDPRIRVEATRKLWQLDGKKRPRIPVACLKSADAEVRRSAAGCLRDMQIPETLPELVEALRHEEDDVAQRCLREAIAAAAPVVGWDTVVRLLDDKHPAVRESGALALDVSRDPRVADLAVRALENECNTYTKVALLQVLGIRRDPRLTEILSAAMAGADIGFAKLATKAMNGLAAENAQARRRFLAAFTHENPAVRYAACGAIISSNMRQRPNSKTDRPGRRLPQDLQEAFAKTLEDENPLVRWLAVVAASRIPNPRSTSILAAVLRGEEPEISDEAILAVGHGGVDDLRANLKFRPAAAMSLGDSGDPAAFSPLLEALHDEDEDVRTQVIEGLGRLKDPRAVNPLIEALNDDAPSVARSAATALGATGDPRAVKPLTRAVENEGSTLRYCAIDALGEIDDPLACQTLARLMTGKSSPEDDSRKVAALAAVALRKTDSAMLIPLLSGGMPDAGPLFRHHAIGLFAQMNDPQAVEHLVAALNDPVPTNRLAAAEALVITEDPRGTEAVLALAREAWRLGTSPDDMYIEKDARARLANSLGRVADFRAVEPLIELLTDSAPLVRANAARGLGLIGDRRATESLVPLLTDLDVSRPVVVALLALGWRPRTTDELVLVLMADDEYPLAKAIWPDTKRVLLSAVHSDDRQAIVFGAYKLLDCKPDDDDLTDELIGVLENQKDVETATVLAQIYTARLEYPILRQAGEDWLAQHPEPPKFE
ncbi:MAG: HEAT repeat domain-containing protein [Planctomycetes bacterium]|nr:HEAT repeat domain-containing protein [Planctomycetota bacterium]